MSVDAERVVAALAARDHNAFEQFVDLALSTPEQLPDFVVKAASMLTTHSSETVDEALDLLPDESLQAVADAAVASLRAGADPDESQATSLIGMLSLQAPQTLQPFLGELWDIAPDPENYDGCLPWRGADHVEIERLATRLNPSSDESQRAWTCLLESRTASGWAYAVAAIGAVIPPGPQTDWSLNLVCIEQSSGGIRRLVTEPACHIEFPRGFLVPRFASVPGTQHPTWHPGSEVLGTGRFGGEVDALCAVCDGPLHRLIAFDEPPENVPEGLQVVTCLSCLGWSLPVMFFAHDQTRISPAGPELTKKQPKFPADALPETTVTIRRSLPRWRLQDWASSNGRENLNRVSGEPTWIQSPEFPACPGCGRSMRFLLQFDSFEIAGGRWWLWGSGGIVYAFWCDGCSLSATYWRCT